MKYFVLASALALAIVSCGEDTRSPTEPDQTTRLDVVATATLAFRQVSVTWFSACGLTTDNMAYCWGENSHGQLGDGTTNNSETPVPVAGGLYFRQITTGTYHTCGIALNNLTYCWGENQVGELGDETRTSRLTPTRVHAGGVRFRRLTAGSSHTCGETTDNLAYCWGYNDLGQLGNGTHTGPQICNDFACSTKPIAVTGGRRFGQISAGALYTCGVTTLNVAFCWGDNRAGQLGNSTNTGPETCGFDVCSTKPIKVAGGLQFRQMDSGSFHTCGVTTDLKAYCWGQNDDGLLGNGTFFQSSTVPAKVRGGLQFRVVSAGGFASCGITPGNVAYCWGRGLGNESNAPARTPVPVAGGLAFRQLDVSPSFRTCGVTTASVAYCWGFIPVPVPGTQ